jgi:aerobic carbon-monoxide dehydrogenase medium subunit
VKPAPFTYHRPESREEVDSLLADYGDEAKILAGGQSLVPILNMRLAAPSRLIDINHLPDEPADSVENNGDVVYGPLVRHSTVEGSELVKNRIPLLAETIHYVAHPAIRSRGTVVGSIAHADPAAELPAVLVVLGGSVLARSQSGTRSIPASEFFAGPLENSLRPDEWVVEVRWPARGSREGFAFEEFARRSGDYALCGVAASARRTDSGQTVSLAYLGVGDVPVKLEVSVGSGDSLEDLIDATVAENLDPPADIHADEAFRAHLARRLGLRAATRALSRMAED